MSDDGSNDWGGDDFSGVQSSGRQSYGGAQQTRDTKDASDLAGGGGQRTDLATQFRDAFRRSGATDAEISSSLADLGFGYGARAGLLGPIDAISGTSPWSRFASTFASGLTQLTPLGRAVTIGDILQRGLTTGMNTALNNQSPFGSIGLGGLRGMSQGQTGVASNTMGGRPAAIDHGFDTASLPAWYLALQQMQAKQGGRIF